MKSSMPQLTIDTNKIKKINVNTCSIEDLRSHPYLDYYQANSIIKMRMQKDGYNELQEILESKLINEEEFQRLLPYLSFIAIDHKQYYVSCCSY